MKPIPRPYTPADEPALTRMVEAAFADQHQDPEIAELIAALHRDPSAAPHVSLVVEDDGVLAGHVLFTPAHLVPDTLSPTSAQPPALAILAPLAVHPDHQRRGLARALIEHGLNRLRAAGVQLVFVLGDPAFYSRFGFTPAMPRRLRPPYNLPEAWHDAWMLQPLTDTPSDHPAGVIRCADSLMPERYWLD
ncbi:MAG: N-acetyltransferase [Phycisphaeraceae bacterium]